MSLCMNAAIDAVECPECGKHSILKADGLDRFCLNCDFHRDLSNTIAQVLADLARQESCISNEPLNFMEDFSDPNRIDLHPLVFIILSILFGFLVV